MVVELLAAWGVKAAWSAFGPIFEDLAKDVAKDAAKSYVGKCFGSVFSSKNDKTLIKATGQMIKELLDLLEYEFGLDEDTEREELISMQRAAAGFLKQEPVQQAIVSLLKEPNYQLDVAVLAQAWQNVQDAPALPEGFSWPKISKRFSRKAGEIRDSIPELKAVFAQELAMQADKAVADNLGPQPDFDLETYAEALLEKFGRPGSLALASVDLDGASYDAVRLWQVFVPQLARECRDYRPQQLERPKGEEEREERLRSYFDQPPRPVLEVCADQQLQRLVILGDPGSGKSSLLRFLALEWARESDPNRRALAPVPLLIELRDYNQWECPSGKSFTGYLHHARNWHRLNQQHVDELLRRPGRVLLLLDGLDEIFDPQQRELAVNDIFRFSNDYPDARIILTSRVVGYKPERLRDAGFRDFMLQDFDEKQIEEFLTLWHQITFSDQEEAERKRQRLAKAVADSRPIKLLAGNPLLLTLMAIINRHEELPGNRFELYEKAAKLLLQNWDTKRHLQDYPGLKAKIKSWAKAEILRKVAVEMQTGGSKAANLIQEDKLINLIGEYLETTFGKELLHDHPRNAAEVLVKQLRERNFILCFLGGDSSGFVHRTFLEYFCAAEFVDQFEKKRSLSLDDLLALYDAHCREDDWHEVLRLICGQVDEQFAGKIIERLTERVDLEKWDEKTELPELLLAVCCLSEVKNLNKITEETGANLLRKVFGFVLQGKRTEEDELKLLKAVKEVGIAWPGKLINFHNQVPKEERWFVKWPEFLVAVYRERVLIEELCETKRSDVLGDCLVTLATYWLDESTHSLIRQKAVQHEDEYIRTISLELLLEYWREDETTEQLLIERSRIDQAAASVYGEINSLFGYYVFQSFDPRHPIPAKHIQKAAKQAGIPPDKIDKAVRSLSAHMGWDITKGSLAGKL